MSYERALELQQIITDRLAETDVEGVLVTLDALRVPAAANRGAICILPPRLEARESFDDYDLQWSIVAVAGPAQDLAAAWRRLDDLVAVLLSTGLPILDAVPDTWVQRIQQNQEGRWPAYTLSLDETLLITRSE